MAIKINFDELCPCGSGRCYIDCHHKLFSKNNWRILKTEEVIIEIKSISKVIKEFYENNISVYENKIFYVVNESTEKIVPSYDLKNATIINTRTGKNYHVVIFDSINIGKAKDSIIAHEYYHVLLGENGFPLNFPKDLSSDNQVKIADTLNETLQDPLIYCNLKSIFNVEEDFKYNVEKYKKYLDSIKLQDFESWRWVFTLSFVKTYLIQEVLFGKNDVTGFDAFIHEKCPDYRCKALKILKMINKNGFDTPYKQNVVIKKFLKKYNLINHIDYRY